MKKNRFKKTVLICTTLLFLIMSCKKEPFTQNEPEEPDLPPLTHTGANTFGCYIDGVPFVANKGESMWDIPAVSVSFNEDTKYFAIQGTRYSIVAGKENKESDDVRIRAFVDDGLSTYEYELFDGGTTGYNNLLGKNCEYYYEDIPDIGKLIITHLDESKNIISGTFNINLVNNKCLSKTTMKITDGRFDFHY